MRGGRAGVSAVSLLPQKFTNLTSSIAAFRVFPLSSEPALRA
jgi:hypothetical protein